MRGVSVGNGRVRGKMRIDSRLRGIVPSGRRDRQLGFFEAPLIHRRVPAGSGDGGKGSRIRTRLTQRVGYLNKLDPAGR